MPLEQRKLLIVGDGGVGKTCLLIRFSGNKFPELYVPAVFENHRALIEVDQRDGELALLDTSASLDYHRDGFQPIAYPESHVVLLAYSIARPDSFESVLERWIGEVRRFMPKVPLILVGCKKDLRDDEEILMDLASIGMRSVTFDEGLALALKIGAGQFFECSAKTGEGVREVYDIAGRAAMEHRNHRKSSSSCIVF
ncbi:ras-like protein family, member Ab [Flagelloscypha sp. PMI_526]|nr:ras-like protein family, member Ab [Flagelloscypha sp. PMI_526]